jgi:hypothetical protein
VIVGGGYGGLYAVRGLGSAPVSVTLIDRRNYHLTCDFCALPDFPPGLFGQSCTFIFRLAVKIVFEKLCVRDFEHCSQS